MRILLALVMAPLLSGCYASHTLGADHDAAGSDGHVDELVPQRCHVTRGATDVTGCDGAGEFTTELGHVSDPSVALGCLCQVPCARDRDCVGWGPRADCDEWLFFGEGACFWGCSSDADCPAGMRCFHATGGADVPRACLWPEE